jgi:hypothetical protein
LAFPWKTSRRKYFREKGILAGNRDQLITRREIANSAPGPAAGVNCTFANPSAISEMETAIVWPAEYLGRLPDLLRAVNSVALAHSLDRDSGWVAAKRGGQWRHVAAGCAIIAHGLRGRRVPVF